MNINKQLIFRITLAFIPVIASIGLINLEYYHICKLMDLGFFSWSVAQWIIRIITAVFFSIGGLTLFRFFKEPKAINISMFLMIFVLIDYYLSSKTIVHYTMLHWSENFSLGLVFLLFWFTMLTIGKNMKFSIFSKRKEKKLGLISLLFIAPIPFLLYFPENYELTEKDKINKLVHKELQDILPKVVVQYMAQEPIIVGFMSTTCGHCKDAAIRLKIAQDNSETFPKVFINFLESEHTVEQFSKETGTIFAHQVLDENHFFEFSGGNLPSFHFYEKNNWYYFITGGVLNYPLMDKLSSIYSFKEI